MAELDIDRILLVFILGKSVTPLLDVLQQNLALFVFWESPLLPALQEEGSEQDPLQMLQDQRILIAIKVQTNGAHSNLKV